MLLAGARGIKAANAGRIEYRAIAIVWHADATIASRQAESRKADALTKPS